MRTGVMFLNSTLACLVSLVSNSMPAKAIDCGQRIVGKTADSYTGNLDAMYTDYNDGRYYFEKLKWVNFKCRVRGGLQSFRLDRRTSPPSGYVYINDHGEETACTRMSIVERKGHQFDCSGPLSGPLSPLKSRFHAACAEHDLCYKTPGTSRTTCDTNLLSNMMQMCDHSTMSPGCDQEALAIAAAMLTDEARDAYEAGQEWAETEGCYLSN